MKQDLEGIAQELRYKFDREKSHAGHLCKPEKEQYVPGKNMSYEEDKRAREKWETEEEVKKREERYEASVKANPGPIVRYESK